jgi:hypothetical protein
MTSAPVELDVALANLLASALPDLFGGATPVVRTSIATDALEIVARESEQTSGDARPTDQLDALPYDPGAPHGPFTLTRPPYPGPRRVRLRSPVATTTLDHTEVAWDSADPRVLRLNLRASRDTSTVTAVEVLYAITAVFATIAVKRTLVVSLDAKAADAGRLAAGVALALAVVELNREALGAAAAVAYADGAYGAASRVKRLRVIGVSTPAATKRLLTLQADVALTVDRALLDFEGSPIRSILTPGVAADPKRPVQIDARLDG